MSRTMTVYVRYKFMYISLPSSAKQQLTRNDKILVSLETMRANFLKFHFKFIAVSQIHSRDSFDSEKLKK